VTELEQLLATQARQDPPAASSDGEAAARQILSHRDFPRAIREFIRTNPDEWKAYLRRLERIQGSQLGRPA
jgi:hypothetical protein